MEQKYGLRLLHGALLRKSWFSVALNWPYSSSIFTSSLKGTANLQLRLRYGRQQSPADLLSLSNEGRETPASLSSTKIATIPKESSAGSCYATRTITELGMTAEDSTASQKVAGNFFQKLRPLCGKVYSHSGCESWKWGRVNRGRRLIS